MIEDTNKKVTIEHADPKWLKEIKEKSFENKKRFESTENTGWISIKGVLNSITEPFDVQKVATMCYEKGLRDPNYKYAGMSVEEIIAEWDKKRTTAANTGIGLDEYIQAVLNETPLPEIEDEDLRKKCAVFDRFVDEIITQTGIKLVGTEVWINSAKYGVRGRIDAIFEYGGKLLIFDWKNSEDITYDSNNYFIGPAYALKNSTANQFTLQTLLYRYIIEEELGIPVIGTRVVQLTKSKFTIHKPNICYCKSNLESILGYARNTHDGR